MIYSLSGDETENGENINAGNGGDIYLNTKQLHIENGGEISTSTETTGNAGNIIVDATEKIVLSGKLPSGRPSMIDSGSEEFDASGDGGKIQLSSQQLIVSEGALISSKNSGRGRANDIIITLAGDADIDNSNILLETREGDAGNIVVQSNVILMKKSNVSTSVLGFQGDGGNITYDNTMTLLNKSQIIANAHEGAGGNITINSDHLIRSADSIIDASSKLGINGNVNILSPEIDLSSGLTTLPSNFMDASQWLNTPCHQRGDNISHFVINGRDALPQSPDDLLSVNPYGLIFDTPLGKKIKPMMTKGYLKEAVMAIESEIDFTVPSKNIIANVILATIYMDLGFHKKATIIMDNIENDVLSTDNYFLKSVFYSTRGDLALSEAIPFSEAESNFINGYEQATLSGNNHLIAISLNHLGNYYSVQAQTNDIYNDAMNHYTKALHQIQENNHRYLTTRSVILTNRARIALLMYSPIDALKTERSLDQAIQSVQQLDDNWHKGFYLLSLYQLMHQFDKRYPENSKNYDDQRKTILSQLMTIANNLVNPQLMSYANAYMGNEFDAQNDSDQAIQYTQKAIFVAQQYHLPEIHYRWQWQLAKLLAKNGRIVLSEKAYESAIEMIKAKNFLQQFFHAGRFKSNAFKESIHPIFMEMAHIKLQTKKTDKKSLTTILELIEQAKIAELQNFFKDECIKDKKDKESLLSYLNTEKSKNYKNNVAVIYPILTDPPVMIALLNDGPQLFYANTRLKMLEKNVTFFYDRLMNIEERKIKRIQNLGNKIFQSLIAPLQSCLNDKVNTLIFVPDGKLRMIPFAALYDSSTQKYLCQTYAVVTLPALRLTQKKSLKQSPFILQCGLSLERHGYSELPQVKVELDKIHQIMGGKMLENTNFTTTRLQNELNNTPYNTLHFSTHGTFGNSPRDIQLNTYDKPLKLKNLNSLVELCNYRNQPIDLLTLSACDTARGDERAALGLGGVAVKTGVATAVASLWKVDDKAASEIMTSFYQSLKNNKGQKAQSLRLAQISMIDSDQYSHPFYWAPFVLMGDWQ